MSQVLEQLMNRKSVRAYQDRPVEEEKQQAILKAAMRAPTAGNMMLYSILSIRDQKIKDRLAVTCDHQPFIATAPMVLVFLADYHRFMRRYSQVAEQAGEQPRPLGEGDLLLACADAVIAAQSAVVAADALGLGSCYIGDIIEQFEVHRELLGLPAHVAPVAMVCIGYPTAEQAARAQPPRFSQEYICFTDRYRELSGEELADFCPDARALSLLKNKFNTAFSVEMSRSAREILKNFVADEKNEKNILPNEDR